MISQIKRRICFGADIRGSCQSFTDVDGSSVLLCRVRVVDLSQDEFEDSKDLRCLNDFDCLATVLVRCRGDDGIGKWSKPDGSWIWTIRRMITGASNIGDRAGL